ncbi:MAG TPA: RNA-splicing ligase RtcB [Armatimonadetes bacterium]|nr:RNA-splicing ligase RtcB [Armatimonadota bacterium]
MDTRILVPDARLAELGLQGGEQVAAARAALDELADQGLGARKLESALRAVVRRPRNYRRKDPWRRLAALLLRMPGPEGPPTTGADDLRPRPVPHQVWGRELLDRTTLGQLETAARLPVAVRAAQMPDGHVGYGLPIGGVLATRGAVIPYAVGVDIACRMRLSIYDLPASALETQRDGLRAALLRETVFGVGQGFEGGARRQHAVMEDPAWRAQGLLRGLHDRAWAQLGSSGSGNHFVEFGELETEGVPELGLPAGRYLSLLSHSGSRGLGSEIANHFTRVARGQRRLPKEASALAWLDLDSADGQAYWQAMTLAGRYAAANHELIHVHVARAAGLQVRATVENHHNFAWREEHDGEELIVHRKGATPAGVGVLGIIPGSMGDAGYVVRGRGAAASLNSASHGAGRVMSRKQASARISRAERDAWLQRAGVELLGAGLDESPQAYRRLEQVMAAQADLVEAIASFTPRLVRMAKGGRAED